MSKSAPCLNCEDRHPHCHSTCQKEDYLRDLEYKRKTREGRAEWKRQHVLTVRVRK